MKTRLSATQALAVACTFATLLGVWRSPAWARNEPFGGEAADSQPTPVIHGLAPLAGGASVPVRYRPPGARGSEAGPSSVIFPAQKIPLRFNHRLHVGRLGMTCLQCHRRASSSHRSSDRLLPSASVCDRCHGTVHRDFAAVRADETKLIGQCGYCHRGYRPEDGNRVARVVLPPPHLRFDHAVHHARNIKCAQCHGMVQDLELATADQLPRMRGCVRCHGMAPPARGDAHGECATCHLTARGDLLKTQLDGRPLLPPRWLKGAAHDADWGERHREAAANDGAFCSNCHTTKSCTDCHDGRVRPRKIHSNDWLSLHPIAARQDNPRCSSCHHAQSFCVGCHQRTGVALSGPYGNFTDRGRFHPPKSVWTDPPRSAGHHAWEAQRNLSSCVSCHVERDCVRCHATAARGGPGAGSAGDFGQRTSPHPAGFRSRCRTALRKNTRPCLVCHDPSDPKLGACQ